jgi:hypothetical protein
MPTPGSGAIAALDYTDDERRCDPAWRGQSGTGSGRSTYLRCVNRHCEAKWIGKRDRLEAPQVEDILFDWRFVLGVAEGDRYYPEEPVSTGL